MNKSQHKGYPIMQDVLYFIMLRILTKRRSFSFNEEENSKGSDVENFTFALAMFSEIQWRRKRGWIISCPAESQAVSWWVCGWVRFGCLLFQTLLQTINFHNEWVMFHPTFLHPPHKPPVLGPGSLYDHHHHRQPHQGHLPWMMA